MVSEGVDIPRLRVGVYATSARTELFFRQVVGRFIRRTPAPGDQMTHLFLPSDPSLKRLAAQIEEERNHALGAKPRARRSSAASAARPGEPFHALSSSARRDDDVLQTTRPATPCSSSPTPRPPPSPALAAFRASSPPHDPGRPSAQRETAYEKRERLREERRALVATISRRTGEEHRVINARVNRDVGAPRWRRRPWTSSRRPTACSSARPPLS